MSGPKHLWSGDWRDESAAAAEELSARQAEPRQRRAPPARAAAAPAGAAQPGPSPGPRARDPASTCAPDRARGGGPRRRRSVCRHQPDRLAQTPHPRVRHPTVGTRQPDAGEHRRRRPSTGSACRSRPWHRARLRSRPCGRGAPATWPGSRRGTRSSRSTDRPITGTDDISAAIRGLHAGDRVAMEISHGSALFTTVSHPGGPAVRPAHDLRDATRPDSALVAIPVLACWYVGQQRRARTAAAQAFVRPRADPVGGSAADPDGGAMRRCWCSRSRSRC